MLFSQRYFHAIENNMLAVDIADAARHKLWAWLSANNGSGIDLRANTSSYGISARSTPRHRRKAVINQAAFAPDARSLAILEGFRIVQEDL